jgi:DNA-binding XRE family transcriptional regulator
LKQFYKLYASNTKLKGGRYLMRSNLVKLRKDVGLNQDEMSKIAGVSRSQYCNIEAGNRNGSADAWLKIGLKFNLTIQQLEKLKEVC